MNGQRKDNSSFLKGATKGKPGETLSGWQKKPHFHRALIRGGISFPVMVTMVLALMSARLGMIALGCTLILWAVPSFRSIRLAFFMPVVSTDPGNDRKTQHWILRPKWRYMFRKRRVPGQMTRLERKAQQELPPDLERVVRESINAGREPGEMPASRVATVPRSRRR